MAAVRTEARHRALELVYEAAQKDRSVSEVIEDLPVAPEPYAVALAEGVAADTAVLDATIERHAHNWTIARMPLVDVCVLRLAVYELSHQRDVPVAVVIDEAVELAKTYSTEDSGRFVNGVLAGIGREVRPSRDP